MCLRSGRKQMVGWREAGNKRAVRPGGGRRRRRRREKREREENTGVLNSFRDTSGNITNPKVVFTSLCAMIPGGIVKA